VQASRTVLAIGYATMTVVKSGAVCWIREVAIWCWACKASSTAWLDLVNTYQIRRIELLSCRTVLAIGYETMTVVKFGAVFWIREETIRHWACEATIWYLTVLA